MALFDACVGREIEPVHVRHEAAAVHMADAWGRLTGEVGVAMLTAGPGHANALSAMYTARMAQAPVLVLSGASAVATRGRGAFQEMPQAELAAPLCKHAATVEASDAAGVSVRAALRLAAAPTPGPVHLSSGGARAHPLGPQPGADHRPCGQSGCDRSTLDGPRRAPGRPSGHRVGLNRGGERLADGMRDVYCVYTILARVISNVDSHLQER